MNLKKSTSIITGGAHRVGKAIALELANYGSNIILHYGRSKEKAEETVNEIKDLGVEVEAYSADLFSEMEIDNLFEKINENYTLVSSTLVATEKRPAIKIEWRIYTKNPDKPLIRDLIIEGLSLARTQKEEFNSIIQSAGGDVEALLANLRNFSND